MSFITTSGVSAIFPVGKNVDSSQSFFLLHIYIIFTDLFVDFSIFTVFSQICLWNFLYFSHCSQFTDYFAMLVGDCSPIRVSHIRGGVPKKNCALWCGSCHLQKSDSFNAI